MWVAGVDGGRIGRSRDNDWVLPDSKRYLSGHHALVACRQGEWWITDTSSNGTYLNDSTQPIGHGQSVVLRTGDRLRLAEYTLEVEVLPDDDIPPDEPAMDTPQGRLKTPLYGSPAEQSNLMEEPATARMALGVAAGPRRGDSGQVTQTTPIGKYPADSHATQPSLRPFWRATGINPTTTDGEQAPATLSLAGQLIRELVIGLISNLQAPRSCLLPEPSVDDSIRELRHHLFGPGSSVDEALKRMLAPTAIRSQSSVEAVRHGFADLRRHEQALQVALSAALDQYLTRLDPTTLGQRYRSLPTRYPGTEQHAHEGFEEYYADYYRALTARSANGMPMAFAEEFSKAYCAALHPSDHAPSDAATGSAPRRTG
jgi:predicted component of type VI protein secretion system